MINASGEVVPAQWTTLSFAQAGNIAELLVKEGDAITVVTWGNTVNVCLDAAMALSDSGIAIEIIDLRTVFPLDEDTVLASTVTCTDADPADTKHYLAFDGIRHAGLDRRQRIAALIRLGA